MMTPAPSLVNCDMQTAQVVADKTISTSCTLAATSPYLCCSNLYALLVGRGVQPVETHLSAVDVLKC